MTDFSEDDAIFYDPFFSVQGLYCTIHGVFTYISCCKIETSELAFGDSVRWDHILWSFPKAAIASPERGDTLTIQDKVYSIESIAAKNAFDVIVACVLITSDDGVVNLDLSAQSDEFTLLLDILGG